MHQLSINFVEGSVSNSVSAVSHSSDCRHYFFYGDGELGKKNW